MFQVGGNLGGSIGPLLVALIVAPHDRRYVLWFLVFAALCFAAMRPICSWYKNYLAEQASRTVKNLKTAKLPLSKKTHGICNRNNSDTDILKVYLYGVHVELLHILFDR